MNPNDPIFIGDEVHRIDDDVVDAEVINESPVMIPAEEIVVIEPTPMVPVEIISTNDQPASIAVVEPVESAPVNSEPSVQYIGGDNETKPNEATTQPNESNSEPVEMLTAHETASRLPYTATDVSLASIGLMVGVMGGGLAAVVCYLTSGLGAPYDWISCFLAGAGSFLSGMVMTVLALSLYSKFRYNRAPDSWRVGKKLPGTFEAAMAVLLAVVFDLGMLMLALIFCGVGGGIAVFVASALPPWAALAVVTLVIPALAFFLSMILIEEVSKESGT
ncbi:MAG: hypothetical protein AAFN77_04365 [Planctomycetota bacterium]